MHASGIILSRIKFEAQCMYANAARSADMKCGAQRMPQILLLASAAAMLVSSAHHVCLIGGDEQKLVLHKHLKQHTYTDTWCVMHCPHACY